MTCSIYYIATFQGPVMAGTFGSVIRDKALQKMGVQNEVISLGIATFIGFCYGSLICLLTDKYGENDWPTLEMISRYLHGDNYCSFYIIPGLIKSDYISAIFHYKGQFYTS